ncbi:acyl CoA:acetate/3-ketoacid CoA transferase [Rhizobium laguerreae]|uniref:acyl CoA:acetate/3-ketoacid CoA transferase n=1 Tax=Rhizobium laguerreae TaxID=1076926 RepID=UPI001C90FE39|nr:CoA-transferase [Rhizobium laguerreae]MBY3102834.1 acyl CoA:acetate/3-ketoacid CoA transferase [Rhizobium laguerreae]
MPERHQIAFYGKGGIDKSTTKIVSGAEAVAMIRSGDTVAFSGFVGIGTPEAVIWALEKRFLETGEPSNLTLVFAAAPGDGKGKGLNRLAHDGLVKRLIGGHFKPVPKLAQLAASGECEAYNLPLGVMSHLYREIAGGKPWLISKVGLGTFVDPRNGGGKLNSNTTEDLVEMVEFRGEEWLLYKAFPIDVVILRGTTADPSGNVTMEKEAATLDNLQLAMAAKARGGIVIVQVERIAAAGSLKSRDVKIPGHLVDYVVVAAPEDHMQTYATYYNGAFSGEFRAMLDRAASMKLDARTIIARRAAFELPMGGVVNLGIGIPAGIAAVANEENIANFVTLTTEAGSIGGVPQGDLDFGAAMNAESIIDQNQMFDLIDSRWLNFACLGFGQADKRGNINASNFGGIFAGAGGFINISQNTDRLVFCGMFTADDLRTVVKDGKLAILREGRHMKFVEEVEQITFSGEYARERHQPVLAVTERCVFSLTPEGWELIEVAPGIDIERDILAQMKFLPIIRTPREMEAAIFNEGPMGLDRLLLERPLSERMEFDAERNTLFLKLERYNVHTSADVETVHEAVVALNEKLGRRFSAVINYDAVDIASDFSDAWFAMAAEVERRCYDYVARYATSAFLRRKLEAALTERGVDPHVFERQHEAVAYVLDAAGKDSIRRS